MPVTDTATLIVACKAQGTEQLDKVGKKLSSLDGLAGKAMGTFASIFAVHKIVQFGKECVQTFSDLEEETNKFNVVFQGLGERTTKILQELNKNFGLSELSAKKMLAGTGDILTGFGFAREQALDFAEAAAKLGADLASFSNYAGGAEGATTAITKAMLGEAEMVKSLGIVINQETKEYKDMKQQALTTGVTIDALGKTFKASSETQAKAIVAIAMAYKQSPNAIGDFVRSQDSIANQSRILSNAFIELRANVGRLLNDLFSVGGGMQSITQMLGGVNDYLKQEGKAWVFAIQSVFIDISAGAQRAFAVMRFAFEPIFETVVSGFQNIFKIGQYVFDNFEKIVMNFPSIAKAVFLDLITYFKEYVMTMIKMQNTLGKSLFEALKAGFTGKSMTDAFVGEWKKFGEDFVLRMGKVGDHTAKAFKKAGIKDIELKGFGDFKSGWGSESFKKMTERLKEIDTEAVKAHENLSKLFGAGSEGSGGSPAKGSSAAASSPFTFDFGKEIYKFQATAFSAVAANSEEAARLQSRRFVGSAPNFQKTQAEESKKISANTARTAQLTENMLSKLDDISNAVGGLSTSTVG